MKDKSVKQLELIPVFMDDVDRFSKWEIELGWDIESTQLTAGANEIRFDHFAYPELMVSHFTSKRSMQNVFSVPPGMVIFLICKSKSPAFWNSRTFPPTLMAIVRSGLEHWVVLPDDWECYEFIVSEEFIMRTELFPRRLFVRTSISERAYLPLMEPVTTMFLQQMDIFFQQHAGIVKPPRITVHEKQFFDFIINGLIQVVDAGLNADSLFKPKRTRCPDLAKKAREYITAHLDTDFSIDEMAQTLGVSNRVLNYAFKDSLGVSPFQYIQTERLHSVRRQLIHTDLSVTEASQLHGFNSPSRFSHQYSRLFGELPSATRHKHQR
jgi:AraC-like DNA-binding protein